MKREHRAGLAEVRAVTSDGTPSVTLHCIRPGVVDDYGSLWMPDTFDESLATRLPTLCWTHDWTDPLGRGVDYRTSGDGPEVIFEFDDFEAVPSARRAHAQVVSGTIRDCSVGFSNAERRDPTDAERAAYPGICEVIYKADLDEVSLVLRGAVPGAKVLAVRSPGQVISAETAAEVLAKLGAGELDLHEALGAIKSAAQGDEPGDDEPQKTPEELEAEAAALAQAEQEAAEAQAALEAEAAALAQAEQEAAEAQAALDAETEAALALVERP